MTAAEETLAALCLRGLLRHLGGGERSPYSSPVEGLRDEDLDALRMWWALSAPVGLLARRCATRPREIAASLGDVRREVSGELPGPPDAAASALLQAISADPAAFVVTEAAGTWLSGPNRVLAKTLEAAQRALRSAALHARGGLFDGPALERLALIDDALRTAPLREILSSPAGRARIDSYERRQAAKARAPLYRNAWECASALYRIEAFEPESLSALLASEVLPRVETWRQFEMACLLEIAEALSAVANVSCVLDASFVAGRAAAQIGEFSVWWQRAIRSRPEGELDEGERMARNLAASLGVTAGTARADLTVEKAGRVLAIVECKWFASTASASGAILDACHQLTGYARDAAYRQGETAAAILSRSIVALADRGPAPLTVGTGPVACVGLADLGSTALRPWAESVIAAA